MLEELNYAARIVGVKQLRRALADGRVRKVFLADDADPALTDPIREAPTGPWQSRRTRPNRGKAIGEIVTAFPRLPRRPAASSQ